MTPALMKERLLEAFPDSHVEVQDLTGTANHFEVHIASSAFKGLSRIQTHQSVMGVFKDELATGEVHALSIRTEATKPQDT